jgi:hypothetical protein
VWRERPERETTWPFAPSDANFVALEIDVARRDFGTGGEISLPADCARKRASSSQTAL